jgi:hypothetical protein
MLCAQSRASKMVIGTDIAEKAVQVLHRALSNRVNQGGPYNELRALAELVDNKTAAVCAVAAGCIELVIGVLRRADKETGEGAHSFVCRALAHLCFGVDAEQIDAYGLVDIAFGSLRMFSNGLGVQLNGLKILLSYTLHDYARGAALLDHDLLGADAVQTALSAMRMSCQRIHCTGCSECSGVALIDVLSSIGL